MTSHNYVSLAGIAILVAIAWILSSDRKRMNWRVVGWGIGLQLLFAIFVFKIELGRDFFVVINDVVVDVIGCARHGTEFVFGPLAVAAPGGNLTGSGSGTPVGFILIFQALSMVVFFSALVSVLYYCRIMPLLIRGFAWVFTRLMRISGAESLCASSNIFVGIESTLLIRPHLNDMTRSELCTVLTAGMATVASTILAAYVSFLEAEFPSIAGHLVSASILSAPAAIVMSKILVPEDGTPVTLGITIHPEYERDDNVLMAIINGANSGIKLLAGIVALLLAVVGFVALANLATGFLGSLINPVLGLEGTWSLQGALAYLFRPLAYIIGVPSADTAAVADLLGQRVVLTEIPSYIGLNAAIGHLQPRSVVIAAYALCGFAHLPSLAIFVGGISALAPRTAKPLASIAFRALLAATLACLLTACMAGLCFTEDTHILLASIR